MRCVNSLDISLDSYLEYQQPVAVLPHASGYYKFERFVADMCSRDVILELRSVRWELSAQVRSTHLLWSRLAVAVPAAVVGQVNTSRLDVTASPTAKPATGKIPVLSATCSLSVLRLQKVEVYFRHWIMSRICSCNWISSQIMKCCLIFGNEETVHSLSVLELQNF